jgi:predicted DCC family thiol-disulfide oxidoreductase YuxK
MGAPNLPVLVFDGGCGICTRCARWVEHRVPGTTQPWQVLDLRSINLSPTDVADYAWWVAPGDVRRRGHRAIAGALRAVGGGWGIVGRLLDVPPISWLAAIVYHLVARNRHHLRRFGVKPACADGGCDEPIGGRSAQSGLVGQAEHPLADDVALDLAGPPADRQGG